MNGTSASQTFERIWMPPKSTMATEMTMARPTAQSGTPGKLETTTSTMEPDCTAEPMPNAAMDANTANATAPSFAQPGVLPSLRLKARSHAYMAPPSISPLWSLTRYLTDSEDLGILRGNAEHAREPYPEHRARAAREDGRRHAHDVARADGGGKRRGKRAELADIAFGVVVLPQGHLDGGRQLALDDARAERQEDVRAQQQDDHGRTPDRPVDSVDDADYVHAWPPFAACGASERAAKQGVRRFGKRGSERPHASRIGKEYAGSAVSKPSTSTSEKATGRD